MRLGALDDGAALLVEVLLVVEADQARHGGGGCASSRDRRPSSLLRFLSAAVTISLPPVKKSDMKRVLS